MKAKAIFSLYVILAVLFLDSPVSAQFYTGNCLVELMREYERAEAGDRSLGSADWLKVREYGAFVCGVFDATSFAYGDMENVTMGQVLAIVAKFLKANPESWNRPAAHLVMEALLEAFPAK